MGAYKTDNHLHVFVGSAVEGTSVAAASTGDIILLNEANAIHGDAVGAGEYVKIGQKDAEGNVRFSPLFKYEDMIKVRNEAKADRAFQQSDIGFNGSSGSIEAINSNRYTLRVNFKHDVDMFSEQSDLHFFEYVSDASATQQEIVDYFAQVMSKHEKFSGKASGKHRAAVKVERYNSNGSTATEANNGTDATFTNGSTQVTFTNVDADAALIAGNYLSIAAADDTPADTDPIYKIVSIDASANTAIIDQPFQGASGTLGDDKLNILTAANAASGDAGLRITGLATKFITGLSGDHIISFEVTLDGWGATTAPVLTTSPKKGVGHSREVADLEWFGQGAMGAPYRHGVPNNSNLITSFVSGIDEAVTSDYNMTYIDVKMSSSDPLYPVAGSGVGRFQIIIAYSGTASNISTPLADKG